ncbi:hypothetical protein PanWU01x14_049680 [Parasponia andersonii]|uniref:Uncharacterized protein n=1 Tax=Parasponia andersonii TaxID=3476 RepID=A0A2P5DMP4_PARAD|nr:hypothetical protein PanWU01x14_049680 [Parasponia andersonii]
MIPRTMMVQQQKEMSSKTSIEDLNPREIDKEAKIRPIKDLEDLSIDDSLKVLKIGVKLQDVG